MAVECLEDCRHDGCHCQFVAFDLLEATVWLRHLTLLQPLHWNGQTKAAKDKEGTKAIVSRSSLFEKIGQYSAWQEF
eukprot:6371090-Amphidinium_carterae.1